MWLRGTLRSVKVKRSPFQLHKDPGLPLPLPTSKLTTPFLVYNVDNRVLPRSREREGASEKETSQGSVDLRVMNTKRVHGDAPLPLGNPKTNSKPASKRSRGQALQPDPAPPPKTYTLAKNLGLTS